MVGVLRTWIVAWSPEWERRRDKPGTNGLRGKLGFICILKPIPGIGFVGPGNKTKTNSCRHWKKLLFWFKPGTLCRIIAGNYFLGCFALRH